MSGEPKLTPAMRQLLARAPAGWQPLPAGVGCTNATLEALEKRGLVEICCERFSGGLHDLTGHCWKWKRKGRPAPQGGGEAATPPPGPSRRAAPSGRESES